MDTVELNKTISADFGTVIRERRSVRKYDASYKMSQAELEDLLADAVLAPSGSNLQPWRFIVITDQATKEKLLPIAFNQQQVVTASAVIAVLADLEAYKEAGRIYDKAVAAGYMNQETRDKLVDNSVKFYGKREPEAIRNAALIDGGLVSMQLMLAAKAKGFDTVPMAGYNVEQFRELMGITDRYANVMLIAVGKAAEPGHPTVRLDVADITYWNQFGAK
nr:nitroreductase family protein [Paenibacillus beijingensis]